MAKKSRKEKRKVPARWGLLIVVGVSAAVVVASMVYLVVGGHFGGGRATGPLPSLEGTARPLPATLSPEQFTGKTARAYQVAREIPYVLEKLFCYCGCDWTSGHKSNLDCFRDEHAVTWDTCQDEALEALALFKKGYSIRQIQDAIDKKFAHVYPYKNDPSETLKQYRRREGQYSSS